MKQRKEVEEDITSLQSSVNNCIYKTVLEENHAKLKKVIRTMNSSNETIRKKKMKQIEKYKSQALIKKNMPR